VVEVDVTPGEKLFSVTYDPARITTDRMLEGLRSAREAATLVAIPAQDVEFVHALERAQEDRPSALLATARIAPPGRAGHPPDHPRPAVRG